MQSWNSLAISPLARLLAVGRRLPWRWLAPLSLLLAGLLIERLAHLHPVLVDRIYSRGLYPYLGRAISRLSSPFGFSLAEVLIATLPIAGLAFVLWRTRSELIRGDRAGRMLLSRTRELIWFTATLFFLFQIVFGLNYQRLPLAMGLQLSRRQATAIELESIAAHIIAEINRNYDESRQGPRPDPGGNRDALFQTIELAFQSTDLLGEASRGGFGPPKPVYSSRVLSSLGIAGIYSPLTGEPNFNTNQPESELPFSIAHEKAHQRGYAREDEASFVGFLVCIKSSDPFVRYSGFLRGLRVLAPLRSAVSAERYGEIINQLAPAARADLRASAEFWKRVRHPKLGAVAEQANNTYLRANGVSSGIGNYGEVVSLMISYYLTHPVSQAGSTRLGEAQ